MFIKNIVIQNTLYLSVVQMANIFLPLLTIPYLARVLGVEQYGVFALAQSVCVFGLVFVDYGFNLTATQQIAKSNQDPKEISSIFWSTQLAKIFLLIPALVILGLLVLFFNAFHEIRWAILASTPILIGSILFPQWFFQGIEKMMWIAIFNLVARLITLPLIFIFVQNAQDVVLAVLIQTVTGMLAGIGSLIFIYQQKLLIWKRPQWAQVLQTLKEGWHIFISGVATSLYTAASPALVGLFSTPFQVGLYSAADKIKSASQSLVGPIGTAVYPRINALMTQSNKTGVRLAQKILLIQGGATFFLSLITFTCAPQIISILMGSEFDEAILILRILSPIPFLTALSNVFGIQLMLPLGKKKAFSIIVGSTSAINIIVISVLAYGWGALGAAIASFFAELLVTCLMFAYLVRIGVNPLKKISYA
jgi:PST family polysaccharide transporter